MLPMALFVSSNRGGVIAARHDALEFIGVESDVLIVGESRKRSDTPVNSLCTCELTD